MYLIQIYYALTTGITGEKGNQHRRASWIGGLHILIYSFREYVFSFSLSKQLISKMVNFKHCNELKKHDFFSHVISMVQVKKPESQCYYVEYYGRPLDSLLL